MSLAYRVFVASCGVALGLAIGNYAWGHDTSGYSSPPRSEALLAPLVSEVEVAPVPVATLVAQERAS